MKRIVFAFCALLITSCRSDYAINLKEVAIYNLAGGDNSGHILVDKKSGALMSKYGTVDILAKTCADETCREFSVGFAHRHEGVELGNSVRMSVDFDNYDLSVKDKQGWMRPLKCFRIEASQGYLGRNGQSGWNCSAVIGH